MTNMVAESLTSWLSDVFVDQFDTWIMIGFVGQAAFMSRFLVQWIASERAGRSIIPLSFWFLSIGGALILLLYAIIKRDPVFIVGQSLGLFVYVRNLMLIRKERAANQ